MVKGHLELFRKSEAGNMSCNIHILQFTSYSSQVDKRAAETGVEGFAGWPLRLWLPHLQASRRPHGSRGGNDLAEADRELADLRDERGGEDSQPRGRRRLVFSNFSTSSSSLLHFLPSTLIEEGASRCYRI